MLSEVKRIPGYSRYGITSDGDLFNLLNGSLLKTTKNPRGYHTTILVNDNGKRKGVKRHRLVALAHLEWPSEDIEKFVVNHKDSTPGNDWKDNLEWCTQKRNVEHSIEQGAVKKSIMVEVLDEYHGDIKRYSSIAQCSKDIGLERYSIQLRVDRGAEYVWPEGKRYRAGNSYDPWPETKKLDYGRAREVVMKNLRTDVVFLFGALSDTLPHIGYKLAAVWKWASDPNQPVIPRLFQIQFADDMKPWREVKDVFEELQDGMRNKVVFMFDENWEDPIWYESAAACAELNRLKPTALNYRLKSKGLTVYSDGKRYCYYDDLTTVQKKTIRYEVPKEGCVQRPSKATVIRKIT